MKKGLAGVFALLLAFALALSASALDRITVSAGNVNAPAGGEARLEVTLEDNPGMIGLQLRVVFDHEKLELISVEDGGILGDEVNHSPENASLSWENYLHEGDFTENGVLCTLVFRLTGAEKGEVIPVTLEKSTENYAAINMGLENIAVSLRAGSVTVVEPGAGESGGFPWIPFAAGTAILLAAGATAFILIKKKKKGDPS